MWDDPDSLDEFEMDYDSEFEDDHFYSTCPNCQASVYEDTPQCPNCGEYIVESDLSTSSKWYSNPWVVTIVVLILLLSIFLFWVVP